MSKMSDKSHEESLKLRTEVKEYIDRMVASGIPVTKKAVMKGANVSNGFVNNKEITEYINKAKEKQAEQDLRVDVSLQNTILFRNKINNSLQEIRQELNLPEENIERQTTQTEESIQQ